MPRTGNAQGLELLHTIRRRAHGLLLAAALFSAFVNILMLTAPIYMLQIYDRVLSSQSVETLTALSLLMAFLFLIMGCLDYARGRILTRIGARFQTAVEARVFPSEIHISDNQQHASGSGSLIHDIDAIRRAFSSPALTAAFDMPWVPMFLAAIWLFHPWLGTLALIGGSVLIGLALLNQHATRDMAQKAATKTGQAELFASRIQAAGPILRATGLSHNALTRWQKMRSAALATSLRLSDRHGQLSVTSKTFRQFLQSAMLGLGAYLAIIDQISPGVMIAASVLLSRALAPIDMAISQWGIIQRARSGWTALGQSLGELAHAPPKTELPPPDGRLELENVTYIPEHRSYATLQKINLRLSPGEVLGIAGPSGSGKSTLANLMAGGIRQSGGKIRLGAAALEHYEAEKLGQYIGYLPQIPILMPGTIAQNIARLSTGFKDATVIAAAIDAGAHELILSLPDGYDTPISYDGAMLSGGQIQQICLARAFFNDPALIILDEPATYLDHSGLHALDAAIRTAKARGATIVITAHHTAGFEWCDRLVALKNGKLTELAPPSAPRSDQAGQIQTQYPLAKGA